MKNFKFNPNKNIFQLNKWFLEPYLNRLGDLRVNVYGEAKNCSGKSQQPVLYDNDELAWDFPYEVPKYIKQATKKFLLQKTGRISIDLVEYPFVETKKTHFILFENPFGMEGINVLNRKNAFGDNTGILDGDVKVIIEEERIEIRIREDSEKTLEDVIRYISDYYPSVGWEFLETDKNW